MKKAPWSSQPVEGTKLSLYSSTENDQEDIHKSWTFKWRRLLDIGTGLPLKFKFQFNAVERNFTTQMKWESVFNSLLGMIVRVVQVTLNASSMVFFDCRVSEHASRGDMHVKKYTLCGVLWEVFTSSNLENSCRCWRNQLIFETTMLDG